MVCTFNFEFFKQFIDYCFKFWLDSHVVRDNPTLSMINDSDEDVIYGSDTEEPLNPPKLIDTKNDDEESDWENNQLLLMFEIVFLFCHRLSYLKHWLKLE